MRVPNRVEFSIFTRSSDAYISQVMVPKASIYLLPAPHSLALHAKVQYRDCPKNPYLRPVEFPLPACYLCPWPAKLTIKPHPHHAGPPRAPLIPDVSSSHARSPMDF